MILNNGDFTEAVFINGTNGQVIEAVWVDHDTREARAVAIEVNLKDSLYQRLLNTFTIDQINTMTDQRQKRAEEMRDQYIRDLALKSGLLYNPAVGTPHDRLSIDHIFQPPEDDSGTELLFNIKLKIFDLQKVINSSDTQLKRRLREAKTPLEALYICGKFLYE